MEFELLLGILVHTALRALLAAVASLVLRMRLSVLAYIGAGLLGHAIGLWIAVAAKAGDWPGAVTFLHDTTHLLWGLLGALLVLLIVKLARRGR